MIRMFSILIAGLLSSSLLAQTPIWQVSFNGSSPPFFGYMDSSVASEQRPYSIRFSGDGDLLLASLTRENGLGSALRLSRSAGSTWASVLPSSGEFGAPKVFPDEDGGAFAVSDERNWLIKLDGNGSLVWHRSIAAWLVVELPLGRIAVAGCQMVSVLDRLSGIVEWQWSTGIAGDRCEVTDLRLTHSGELLISLVNDRFEPNLGSRIIMLDQAGQLLWEHLLTDQEATTIGTDAMRVYLATTDRITALDATAGTLLWQSSMMPGKAMLIPGNPVVPVAIADAEAVGLSAVNGGVQWNQPIAASDVAAEVGGALLVSTETGLLKMNAQSGAVEWSVTLPDVDSLGNPVAAYLALGGLRQGQLLAVARVDAADSQPPPLVQTVDFLNGQLGVALTVPDTTQANSGTALLANGYVYSMSSVQHPIASGYRLSKADASDGRIVWSHDELPIAPDLMNSGDSKFKLAAAGDLLVAGIADSGLAESNAAVAAWNASTGAPLWRTALPLPGEEWFFTDMLAPIVDADSNVWISLSTRLVCSGIPPSCGKHVQYKLDGSDGSILWQSTTFVKSFTELFMRPRKFIVLDGDLVVERSSEIWRQDGLDGSLEWSSLNLSGALLHLGESNDGNVVVVRGTNWAKLDAATGSEIWFAAAPPASCSPGICYPQGIRKLANGNLIQYGLKQTSGEISAPFVALLEPDLGDYDIWFPEFNSSFYFGIVDAREDADGEIWMQVHEKQVDADRTLRYMTRFDTAGGAFNGFQSLGSYSDSNRFLVSLGLEWLAAPEAGRLPVKFGQAEPDFAPTVHGVMALDASVKSQGNLAVQASQQVGPVMPGESKAFQVNVLYSGNSPVEDVQVVISFPWRHAFIDLGCTSSGSAVCVLEQTSGDLVAKVNLQPGETVSIEGKSLVMGLAAGWIGPSGMDATVQGPFGFLEVDTHDNVVHMPVALSLFHNGFD